MTNLLLFQLLFPLYIVSECASLQEKILAFESLSREGFISPSCSAAPFEAIDSQTVAKLTQSTINLT